jgi:DNA-directed RNA polymerase subunit M/transcription elongation factor TFIIS
MRREGDFMSELDKFTRCPQCALDLYMVKHKGKNKLYCSWCEQLYEITDKPKKRRGEKEK